MAALVFPTRFTASTPPPYTPPPLVALLDSILVADGPTAATLIDGYEAPSGEHLAFLTAVACSATDEAVCTAAFTALTAHPGFAPSSTPAQTPSPSPQPSGASTQPRRITRRNTPSSLQGKTLAAEAAAIKRRRLINSALAACSCSAARRGYLDVLTSAIVAMPSPELLLVSPVVAATQRRSSRQAALCVSNCPPSVVYVNVNLTAALDGEPRPPVPLSHSEVLTYVLPSTPCLTIAAAASTDALTTVLEAVKELDAPVRRGPTSTALLHAGDDPARVAALVAAGAVPDFVDGEDAVLVTAAKQGLTNTVSALVRAHEGAARTASPSGYTALMAAARRGDAAMVSLLLAAGGDAAASAVGGLTAVKEAAASGSWETVQALLAAGAAVVCTQDIASGATPLLAAITNGHPELAFRLLEAQPDAARIVRRSDSLSPLLAAVAAGFNQLAAALVAAGAAVTHNHGRTPVAAITVACTLGKAPPHLLATLAASCPDSSLATAAVVAARLGRPALGVLLDAGADPSAACPLTGTTPLVAASGAGHQDAISTLLARGAVPSTAALDAACAGGHVAAVGSLLDNGIEPGPEALLLACSNGHAAVAQVLRDAGGGTVLGSCPPTGATALHAAASNGHAGLVQWALDAGANANACRSDTGGSPLHAACRSGSLPAVRALLAAGARKNPRLHAAFGRATPVMVAAQAGAVGVVTALLASGADADGVLAIGAAHGHTGVIAAAVKHGCAVSPTTVQAACAHGQAEVLSVLVSSNPDLVGAPTDAGYTPLWYAAQGGHPDCIRVLLAAGANVDAGAGDESASPLHVAAASGKVEAVAALLEGGASPSVPCAQTGCTAIALAAYASSWDAVAVLAAHEEALAPPVAALPSSAPPSVTSSESVPELAPETAAKATTPLEPPPDRTPKPAAKATAPPAPATPPLAAARKSPQLRAASPTTNGTTLPELVPRPPRPDTLSPMRTEGLQAVPARPSHGKGDSTPSPRLRVHSITSSAGSPTATNGAGAGDSVPASPQGEASSDTEVKRLRDLVHALRRQVSACEASLVAAGLPIPKPP